MVERVTPLKRESTATGGDAGDEADWPEPLDHAEDYLNAAGVALQRDTGGGASSNDEACLLSRDSTDAAVFGTRLKAQSRALTLTAVKTGAYTAAAGEIVRVNPAGGTFTVNAPGSPTSGQEFGVWNQSSDVTALTISGNGSNIESPWRASVTASTIQWAGAARMDTWRYDGTAWRLL